MIFTLLFVISLTGFILLIKNKIKCNFLINEHRKKLVTYVILTVIFTSALADYYCISYMFLPSSQISSIKRPAIGEGNSSISINIDSELYTGAIDLEIKDKELSFDEANKLFAKYRKELDSYVLGDNKSFLKVTTPLNLPSSIGTENINISWYISDTDIMDYTGQLITENLTEDGCPLELVATLTYGNNSADICYSVIAYKTPLTPKEDLSLKLDDIINSDDNRIKDSLSLPTEIDGVPVKFYKNKSEFPSMDISYINYSNSCTAYFS